MTRASARGSLRARTWGLLLLLPLITTAAGTAPHPGTTPPPASECIRRGATQPLPESLFESSGVVVSRTHDDLLWTHNDSGDEPRVYGINRMGELLATVRVTGAQASDWEDLALGPCEAAAQCLYLADIGDNDRVRDDLAVYVVPEPSPDDRSTLPAVAYPIAYPRGRRDAEAIFLGPGGELYLVAKGFSTPFELYRYPRPFRRRERVILERVPTELAGEAGLTLVTGADATSDGRFVVIRDYERLAFHRWREPEPGAEGGIPTLVQVAGAQVDLTGLGEIQGEAVAFGPAGEVVLTSEGRGSRPATLRLLSCEAP